MSVLSQKHFRDEKAAYKYVESHVWPEGRVCPHCGVVENSAPLKGKSTRMGVYKCYSCRKPFTVKVGTIFESSHIKLHIWLQAIFLMCSSKKGISANHLHRYAAEFDFRYSNRIKLGIDDVARADKAIAGAWGRRLTYQTAGGKAAN